MELHRASSPNIDGCPNFKPVLMLVMVFYINKCKTVAVSRMKLPVPTVIIIYKRLKSLVSMARRIKVVHTIGFSKPSIGQAPRIAEFMIYTTIFDKMQTWIV
jgi:hypothetical protein